MFVLGVTGCSPLPATSSAKSSYVPGAYTAQAQGKQSLVTVEVTFGENAIEAVEVLGHCESERIANTAISAITSDIVELQSLDVDAVTGATLTSMAILLRSETASGKLAAAFPI
ncbi:MAG: FMN-binding protein [Adlercreutzia equolifaciens]